MNQPSPPAEIDPQTLECLRELLAVIREWFVAEAKTGHLRVRELESPQR